MLEWLAGAADPLVGQAPRVAVDLLTRAVASFRLAQHGTACWQAGSRMRSTAPVIGRRPNGWANRELEHVAEPDLLVDLHWTLAQCRMRAGVAEESLIMLDQALAGPGVSAGTVPGLLVMVARTHAGLGRVVPGRPGRHGRPGRSVTGGRHLGDGLGVARAVVVVGSQGHVADALSLFDQALAVAGADPALDDLRLLLQLNKSVALAQLDRCAEALAAAEQARDLADQIGTVVRAGQAHCALGQLLFDVGRWDDALAEVQIVHPSLIEPGGASAALGLAAIIRFHRGEPGAARRLIAAAAPYAAQLGRPACWRTDARSQHGP